MSQPETTAPGRRIAWGPLVRENGVLRPAS